MPIRWKTKRRIFIGYVSLTILYLVATFVFLIPYEFYLAISCIGLLLITAGMILYAILNIG